MTLPRFVAHGIARGCLPIRHSDAVTKLVSLITIAVQEHVDQYFLLGVNKLVCIAVSSISNALWRHVPCVDSEVRCEDVPHRVPAHLICAAICRLFKAATNAAEPTLEVVVHLERSIPGLMLFLSTSIAARKQEQSLCQGLTLSWTNKTASLFCASTRAGQGTGCTDKLREHEAETEPQLSRVGIIARKVTASSLLSTLRCGDRRKRRSTLPQDASDFLIQWWV